METQSEGRIPPFYIVVLLYEASSDAPDYDPLYEENFLPMNRTPRRAIQIRPMLIDRR
jgi:hypothetical protein